MALDSSENREHENLLEEIRKRAEEAELARIEKEVAKLSGSLTAESAAEEVSGSTFDAGGSATGEVAVDAHWREPAPGAAQDTTDHSKPASPVTGKTVDDLLISSRESYQRENYLQALDHLDDLLALDPNNAEAKSLRAQVEKAKALSDRMKEEELRQRQEDEERAQSIHPPEIPKPERTASAVYTPRREKEVLPEEAVSPLRETNSSRPATSRVLSLFGIAGVLVLGGIAAFVVFRYVQARFFPPRASVLVFSPVARQVDPSVALGLLDEIIDQCGHLTNVNVYAPGTAPSHGSDDGINIAMLYGADYVVQWDVDRTDGRYGASVSVFDTRTRKRLNATPASVSSDGLSGLCTGIVAAIANSLGVDPLPAQKACGAATVQNEAYIQYLQGRYLLGELPGVPLDSVAGKFERSVRLDPSFSNAEAALGWTNVLRHIALSSSDTSRVYLEKASRSLQRALNLGGSSSVTYRLWGVVAFCQADFDQALKRLEHASYLARSDGETQRWLAVARLRSGKREDALRSAMIALECDPQGHSSRDLLGKLFLINSDAVGALREFEVDFRSTPDSCRRVSDSYLSAMAGTNQQERALDVLRERVGVHPRDYVAAYDLGRMYQLAGKPRSDWVNALQRCCQLADDALKVNPADCQAYSYRGLAQTRLGLFTVGLRSNQKALEIASNNADVLYNSARMYALQHDKSAEARRFLHQAINRRFSIDQILDIDLAALPNYPDILGAPVK